MTNGRGRITRIIGSNGNMTSNMRDPLIGCNVKNLYALFPYKRLSLGIIPTKSLAQARKDPNQLIALIGPSFECRMVSLFPNQPIGITVSPSSQLGTYSFHSQSTAQSEFQRQTFASSADAHKGDPRQARRWESDT